LNKYERAIFEVGCVLTDYIFDKKFHALGFGGAPNYLQDPEENGKNSRCWNLDGSPLSNLIDAKVDGVNGSLAAYQNAVLNTTMMGPTYFADTLKRLQQIIEAERAQNDKLYFVFVILTDGCIHDMNETCK
jgi:hypothetical protein